MVLITRNDDALAIFEEQKLPSFFDIFIQGTNRVIEMSKGTLKPTFEDFCKGLINEKDRLIDSAQLSNNKAIMAYNKNNPDSLKFSTT